MTSSAFTPNPVIIRSHQLDPSPLINHSESTNVYKVIEDCFIPVLTGGLILFVGTLINTLATKANIFKFPKQNIVRIVLLSVSGPLIIICLIAGIALCLHNIKRRNERELVRV